MSGQTEQRENYLVPDAFDLAAIQTRLSHVKEQSALYHLFRSAGLDYGRNFQGIEILHYSENEVLSKISLPSQPDYVLSPGILDSALQTCIGFNLDKKELALALPFHVKQVNIYADLPNGQLWCYARKNANLTDKLPVYDLNLLNEKGETLVSFCELTTLPLKKEPIRKAEESPAELQLYEGIWEERPAVEEDVSGELLVVLPGAPPSLAERIKEELEVEVITTKENDESAYFGLIFNQLKESIKQKQELKILILCRLSEYHHYAFISGLFKTASLEYPGIHGKVVSVESLSIKHLEELTSILERELKTADGEVRYVGGRREVKVSRQLAVGSRQVLGAGTGAASGHWSLVSSDKPSTVHRSPSTVPIYRPPFTSSPAVPEA